MYRKKVHSVLLCQAFYIIEYFHIKYLTHLINHFFEKKSFFCAKSQFFISMDTVTYRARIDKTQIGFLNSIAESYEGIAVVRTLHAPSGIVELWISPAFEDLVNEIMNDIADEIGLQYLYKATQRLSS